MDVLMAEAKRRGLRVSLDVGLAPARQVPANIRKAARELDILLVGWNEAVALTGKHDDGEVLAALADLAVPETVVKLGPRGCRVREGDAWVEVPAIPVTAVDTTGAGDAFAAAYLYARSSGWIQIASAVLANAAGAAAAKVLGAGDRMPGPEEIAAVLGNCRLREKWEDLRLEVLERLREPSLAAVRRVERS